MKTYNNQLTKHLFEILSFALFCLCFIPVSNAQSNMTTISAQEATSAASTQSASFGFERAYLSNQDLNQLLQNGSSIRFYTAQPDGAGYQTIIAVAVSASGTETGSYLKVDGLNAQGVSQSSATADVERSKNGGYATVAITVSSTDVAGLMQEGATGIHIMPGVSGPENTLTAVAAQSDGENSTDMGNLYMRNDAPCPNNCGDGFLTNLGQ